MSRTINRDTLSLGRIGILYSCFFVSGAAGLIYEVLWSKYLALYVGATGLAQIIVLATFMGGLAVGSRLFGNIVDKAANPLKVYAFLELGIGAYALLFDYIFRGGRMLFLWIVGLTPLTAGGLGVAKAGMALACILTPTILMGGTMPALSRHLIRTQGEAGPRIARLYFCNSVGAVAGCLLAGYYLIRTFGLSFSMTAGAILNIAAAVVALAASRSGCRPEAAESSFSGTETSASCGIRGKAMFLLVCVGLSGAMAMTYEVAWIRLLTLVMGGSTYSFSIMLATFIMGLSIGSLLLSLRKEPAGYGLIFGISELGVGLAVLAALPFYVRLPYFFAKLAGLLPRDASAFGVYQFFKFLICALVMIIPTILQGVTLPAAAKALTDRIDGLGRRVGLVFAVNTVGTLLGVVLAGFAGLPLLGIKHTLELAVAVNVVVGLAVLWAYAGKGRRLKYMTGSALCIAAIWGLYGLKTGNWDRDVLSAGGYRMHGRVAGYEEFVSEARRRKTVFYRDGVDATIAVQDVVRPEPKRMLVINGKVDASTGNDLVTQKMVGHLPMLCRPGTTNVLIVGIGSGATIGSVLAHDSVERIDVVEISRDVIDASRLFEDINGRYWEDPRVRIFWEDAKTFLQVTDTVYDMIISEPTNPWIAGVAGVFSREFFEECRDHLKDDGIFTQWIQAYEIEDPTFFLILETFSSVFPCYTMWNSTRADTLFVGSPKPYKPDLDRMREVASGRRVSADLSQAGIRSLLPVLSMQMLDAAEKPSHINWLGVRHSDFFPVLEYIAPRGFFVGSEAMAVSWLDERGKSPGNSRLWVQEFTAGGEIPSRDFQNCYEFVKRNSRSFARQPLAWALEWHAEHPDDPAASLACAEQMPPVHSDALGRISGVEEGALTWRGRKLKCRLMYTDYAALRNNLRLPEWSQELLQELRACAADEQGPNDPEILQWCGRVEYDLGMYEEAAENLRKATQLSSGRDSSDVIVTGVLLCRTLLTDDKVLAAGVAWKDFLRPFSSDLRVRLIGAEINVALQGVGPARPDP